MRFRHHPDVRAQATEQGLLLVHLFSGETFRLNATGQAMWELAGAGKTAGEIAVSLESRFGVPRERIESDARALLADLERCRLLEHAREVP